MNNSLYHRLASLSARFRGCSLEVKPRNRGCMSDAQKRLAAGRSAVSGHFKTSLSLLLIFIGTLFPANALAVTSGYWSYTVITGTTCRLDSYSGPGGAVTLPSQLDGYTVYQIGGNLMKNNTTVTQVTIPDTYTSLPNTSCFDRCTALKSVIFEGNNLTTITGGTIFWGCSSLKSVVFPASITNIASSSMFGNCSTDLKLYFPGSSAPNINTDIAWRAITAYRPLAATGWTSTGTVANGTVTWLTVLTGELPTLSTSVSSSSVTANSALLTANVTAINDSALTQRGFLISATSNNSNPLLSEVGANVTQLIDSGTTTGSYSLSATGLSSGVSYTYVAYATNSTGTSYSTPATFTTSTNTAPVITVAKAINVRFGSGTYSSLGAAPHGDTTWNNLSAAGGTRSISTYADGTAISPAVSLTGPTSGVAHKGGGTDNNLLLDYYLYNTGTTSLTNVPSGQYDVYIYSQNGTYYDAPTRHTTFALSASGTSYGSQTPTIDAQMTDTAFVLNSNYLVFSNVTVTDGTLSITASGGGPDFNGFQLVQAGKSLTTINEDVVSGSNTGTLVSALIASISDSDGSAVKGMAVTAVDTANGTWFYSTDAGSTWSTLTGVSTSAARLLKGNDSNYKIRFVPTADYNGYATITYLAWDQTSGTPGGTADVTTNGAATAFSSTSGTATIIVTSVPDAPTVTTPTSASVTSTSATLGGNVTSAGDSTVTARGVVYAPTASNSNPQIGGASVVNLTSSGTTGVFTTNTLVSLVNSTSYSYAAYATSSAGTTYSSVSTFTTTDPTPTLTFATPTSASVAVGSTLTNAATSTLSGGSYGAISYAKAGNGSIAFNGTNQYLSASATLIPNTQQNFTVEAWVYLTAAPTGEATIYGDLLPTSTSNPNWSLSVKGDGKILVRWESGYNRTFTSNTALAANQWYHIAVATNGYMSLYINGTFDKGNSYGGTNANTGTFVIGKSANTGYGTYFPGYISNVRVVNGTCVYTGNFTPPTAPLTATQSAGTNIAAITSGTALLLNTTAGADFLKDSSTNNYTLTNTGTATSNANEPFGGDATVNASTGAVTGVTMGSTTIVATQAAASGYNTAATQTYTLTITAGAPTVTTPSSASIGTTTATLGGNVTSNGGASLTAVGVVYAVTSTNNNPQLSGTGVTNLSSTAATGTFTVNATGLTAGTAYSYAAYATNSQGTRYTSVGTFTTTAPTPTLTFTTPTSASVTVGSTLTNAATSTLSGGSYGSISYTSSDTAKATVNATSGVVTGVATGTTTITATQAAVSGVNASATQTYTLTVGKATPTITWATPAAITYGTALSATQLNATSNVAAGTFSYSPASGTTPSAGTQTLTTTFTPTSTANYNTVTASVSLSVIVAVPGTPTAVSATTANGEATVTFTAPSNTGSSAITGYTIRATATDGSVVTVTATGSPAKVSGLTPGLSYRFTVIANNSAGASDSSTTSDALTISLVNQTITFPALSDRRSNSGSFALTATASSGLPVTFTVISGPALLSGNVVDLTGATGTVKIRASQAGNATTAAAPDVEVSFAVSAGPAAVIFSKAANPGSSANFAHIAAVLPTNSRQGSLLIVSASNPNLNGAVTFALGNGGAFSTTLVTTASSLQTLEAGVQAAPVTYTISGTLIDDVLTGSISPIGFVFSSSVTPPAGPSLASAGFYKSSALGEESAVTYTVIGPNNEILVLTQSAAISAGGLTTLKPDGTFNVAANIANGTAAINGGINPVTTAVTATLTLPGAETVNFSGLSTTTTRTDRLINLSSRAKVGTGESVLITGFVIGGTESKKVLIRAVGPALGAFGLASPLPNPAIKIYQGSNLIAQNDDWNKDDAAEISRLGAFAFTAGSKDAALLTTLAPGAYTAQIADPSGTGTGVALAEIYDASVNPNADYQRLVNISSRGRVTPDDGVLIGGFVVTGNSPKTLLIRGIGPALSAFGIAGALADPALTIYQDSKAIATNEGWANNAAITTAAIQTGAFILASGSKDAAVLITLNPGAYTAQIKSAKNASSGVALIEIYEVP